jgi:hypothetical protein
VFEKFMTDEILYGVDREFLILFHILYAEVLYMLGDVLMHGRLEGFFDYGHCPLRITPRSPMCPTPTLGMQFISGASNVWRASQGIPRFGRNISVYDPVQNIPFLLSL